MDFFWHLFFTQAVVFQTSADSTNLKSNSERRNCFLTIRQNLENFFRAESGKRASGLHLSGVKVRQSYVFFIRADFSLESRSGLADPFGSVLLYTSRPPPENFVHSLYTPILAPKASPRS